MCVHVNLVEFLKFHNSGSIDEAHYTYCYFRPSSFFQYIVLYARFGSLEENGLM